VQGQARADFATELARLRTASGRSLAEVAAVAHVHRTHVSHAEHGRRWPSRSVAVALDGALDADGTLLALWDRADAPIVVVPNDPDLSERLARVLDRPERVDRAVVDHLAALLDGQRRLEDLLGAARVLPTTVAQLDTIDGLSRAARSDVRHALLSVGAQWRQFAAWQSQDLGRPAEALAHHDRALEAAQEIDDANMAVTVMSLKSHLAWSRRDPARAVGLAAAGRRHLDGAAPGVRGLIAQQEARGWALDGDADRAHRLLDLTEELTARAAEHPEDEPVWTYFHDPGRVLFQRGVVDLELGRNARAADLFADACDALPTVYRRDRARYTANLALAAARGGDVDRAVEAGTAALDLIRDTGSSHAVSDMKALRVALRPHATVPAVRDFDAALHGLN
jgi:transcriptional regulator with XRE-family HTH domain